MGLRAAVQGYSHQKMILGKQAEHFLGEMITIGLYGVLYGKAALIVLFNGLDKMREVCGPCQGWLASLKGEGNAALRIRKSLSNQIFHRITGHGAIVGMFPVRSNVRIKAINTVHVAA